MTFAEQLRTCRVLPVVTAHDVDSSVSLAGALARGGMTAIEITLRTPAALDSLRVVKEAIPEMSTALGTVTEPVHLEQAVAAGADFCVSPGISADLLQAAIEADIPLLPGVATPSEVMLGLSRGLEIFKLFPAVPVGGLTLLKALAGPFPQVYFCPTGGLNPDNFRDFLALPNVICCGGSWMVADRLVQGGHWEEIEWLARAALDPG